MNELTPTSIFQMDAARRKREARVIPINVWNGASPSDIEGAEVRVNNLFAGLANDLDAAFIDCATDVMGVTANIAENAEIGAVRTDDIQWRFAEAKNEAFAMLADLRSDILGRLGKLGDVS